MVPVIKKLYPKFFAPSLVELVGDLLEIAGRDLEALTTIAPTERASQANSQSGRG